MAVTMTNQAHSQSGLSLDNRLYHEPYDHNNNNNNNNCSSLLNPAATVVAARDGGRQEAAVDADGDWPITNAINHTSSSSITTPSSQVVAVAAELPSVRLCPPSVGVAVDVDDDDKEASASIISATSASQEGFAERARPAFAAGVGRSTFLRPTAAGAFDSSALASDTLDHPMASAQLAQHLISHCASTFDETKQLGDQLMGQDALEDSNHQNVDTTNSAKLDDEAKLPDKYHDRDNPPLTAQTTGSGTTSSDAVTLLDANWADAQGPFEGPEKLLELWFANSETDLMMSRDDKVDPDTLGLKAVPRPLWEQMLDLVHCKVLSVVRSPHVDAYLLSESSMFVFPHKIILKTCGTTTLLLGLERLLEIVAAALAPHFVATKMHTPLSVAALAGGTALKSKRDDSHGDAEVDLHKLALGRLVQRCFYSRKSFMFPERQKGPHKDWMTEVGLLAKFFGPQGGAAYTVGPMNGDHWLLYTSQSSTSSESDECVQQALQTSGSVPQGPADQSLEMLMTQLSPRACANFFYDETDSLPEGGDEADRGHSLGTKTAQKLGLDTLYPDTALDSFAFDPCGFSANAVVSRPCARTQTIQDGYWTIHVTPEEDISYASFETNVVPTCGSFESIGSTGVTNAKQLIERVVNIFEPGRMCITLFASADLDGGEGNILQRLQLPGYRRTDRILYEFAHYDLYFVQFERV